MMPKKNMSGGCPYCSNMISFSELSERKPNQMVHKCNSCNKYMIFNQRNGARYPLADPTNINSLPNI